MICSFMPFSDGLHDFQLAHPGVEAVEEDVAKIVVRRFRRDPIFPIHFLPRESITGMNSSPIPIREHVGNGPLVRDSQLRSILVTAKLLDSIR
jgi:hypothetical protein